jgi:hypothetical protein
MHCAGCPERSSRASSAELRGLDLSRNLGALHDSLHHTLLQMMLERTSKYESASGLDALDAKRHPALRRMRVVSREDSIDVPVSGDALSRSRILADIYSVDPEGCVQLPCSSKTWEAWLSGDPDRISDPELLLAVFEVIICCRTVKSHMLNGFLLELALSHAGGPRIRQIVTRLDKLCDM